jgi:membrane protein YqaA with SNARE-associated domain
MRPLAIAVLASKSSSLRWLIHLGGPGLILLGLADNSVIPLPGSMDVLTILLAAHRPDIWFYYAIMATAGAVLGGYVTYHLAQKGGKEALERKFSKRTADRVSRKFERWGFGAVAIPALLPPPFPIVPFLVAAGAMQYPRKKFLAALTLGRGVRFTLFAFLGAHYGRHIVRFFAQYYKPVLAVVIVLAVLGGVVGLVKYLQMKKGQREATPRRRSQRKVRAA